MFALVTGASSGIGLAISKELARRGYPLLMVSNEAEKIVETATETATEFNVRTIPLCMDLAHHDSAQKLFDYCVANTITIEIVVNNAGIFFFNDIVTISADTMETMINLHVVTPAMLCRLFAQQMISEQRKGYILNMASIASRMMMPGITLYSATKGFMRNFSRAMRHEVSGFGISITTLSPGAAATGLYNLPPKYMKLGIRLGIIMPPERLAQKAVRKMFKRKAEYIPGGFINRLFIFVVNAMPEVLIKLIRKKLLKGR